MAEGKEIRVVVIAMDGSDCSNYAFDWYKKNVHKPDDFVVVVHCPEYQTLMHHSVGHERKDIEQVAGKMQEEQKKKNDLLESLKQMLTDADISGKVKSIVGHPGEVIVKAAQDESAHLIVTGTRGLSKLRRTFLGSISDYVLHHAHIPVIVCRQ
ncbi:universal stress protein Slr1101-like [Gigantopelta aegis]|uniref:universal stress protein Slr1101-like n=1 Tax=Gigantopelta aegis TaxID=1735272 RepID=UPI001B8887C7|nr:universal stress protein Slr1101-like [Gigantopelta aegis]